MKQEDERGFLSGKFENWSGEPIPNGWNSIESKINKQKRRNNLVLAGIPLLVILSYFAAGPERWFEKSATQETAFADKETRLSNSVKESQVPVREMKPSAEIAASSTETSPSRIFAEKPEIHQAPVQKAAQPEFQEFQAVSNNKQFDGVNQNDIEAQYASSVVAAGSENKEIPFSENRSAGLNEEAVSEFLTSRSPEFVFSPAIPEPAKPVLLAEQKNAVSAKGWYNRFFTFQSSWAVSEIKINHAQSELWKYSASSAGFSKAGNLSMGFRLEKPLRRTTSLLYGMDAGIFVRRTETQSQYKIPVSYQMVSEGNSRYQVLPEHQSEIEIRESLLVFARAELGIRQAITRNSGLIVSASIWTRLASASRSNLENASGFKNGTSSVSPGGRIGYWLQTAPFTRLEFSFATMPENLSPQTQSLVFRTNTLGFTLAQGF